MLKNRMRTYASPFSGDYWRDALADFKNPRILCFAALMIAACVALSYLPSIRIDLTDLYTAKVTWGFLARCVCGMVCGPVTALVFGFAEDTVSFVVKPSGAPYFPGYALTTMLGTLFYALFLYRAKPTLPRVFLAKLCTSALNVTLGALWSSILSGKGYLYYAGISFWKNLLMLPVQTLMLVLLLNALYPVLCRMGLAANEEKAGSAGI
ncbi:folate family ECF transporter S component [Vermiculatibacterium agrestimuris]|uniref:folate family ECF transporter S component n=1 Tax=Vermiculatibacterium agrestimuris TaxID=2941519 RepID=UPI0020400416|nr:folate family ECF transporter S component [Vermiculatibacterium agrestimuris]